MDIHELILNNSTKVRNTPSLMLFYIEAFEKAFGYKPNCAGCTFNEDFRKLQKHYNEPNKETFKSLNMESDYKLKKIVHEIKFYHKEGKTHRLYDNLFERYPSFVNEFLTNGSKEEIAERKALFAILPEKFRPKVKKEVAEDDDIKVVKPRKKKTTK